jgi:asparagine synthase (glutamine-hydrolysing)
VTALALGFVRDGQPDEAAVRRALSAAPHRGTSVTTLVVGSCALGLARRGEGDVGELLAEDGWGVAIAGEVDNLGELAANLRRLSVEPRADTAGSLLLAAFRAVRNDLPGLLRGAYAIALTDGKQLTCFRDHLGHGLLFYRDEPHCFWAASEAKQILAGARLAREPDLDTLEAIFYGDETDTTGSSFRGIARLPKATLLEVGQEGSRPDRYWSPERLLETSNVPVAELGSQFDSLMGHAVERVLRGREMLALSGGIDSPAVAGYAAPAHIERFGRPLPALSMVFPHYPSCDERQYIEEAAGYLKMPLQIYEPDPGGQRLDGLGDWVQLVDGPWSGAWAPAMDSERYQKVRTLGYEVLITGDLAEMVVDFRLHLVPHLLLHGRPRALLRQLRVQRGAGRRYSSLARQLATALAPSQLFRWYRQRRPRLRTPAWIDGRRVLKGATSDLVAPRDRWNRQQLAGMIGPGISMEAHQIFQEANGVRIRRPWGDVDLWEFFLSLPAEIKFPDARSKSLVRDFIRGKVPDSIVDRTDKTLLDEFVEANFDYQGLRYWLRQSEYRMPGVDYETLEQRIERDDLGTLEFLWARDLACIHAFMSAWGPAPQPEQSFEQTVEAANV